MKKGTVALRAKILDDRQQDKVYRDFADLRHHMVILPQPQQLRCTRDYNPQSQHCERSAWDIMHSHLNKFFPDRWYPILLESMESLEANNRRSYWYLKECAAQAVRSYHNRTVSL